jgi:hypothetical protein
MNNFGMNAMGKHVRRSVAVLLLLFVIGCSAHPRRINCEGRLTPINPPATTAHETRR